MYTSHCSAVENAAILPEKHPAGFIPRDAAALGSLPARRSKHWHGWNSKQTLAAEPQLLLLHQFSSAELPGSRSFPVFRHPRSHPAAPAHTWRVQGCSPSWGRRSGKMPALGKPLGDGSAGLSGCWLLAAAGSSPAVTVPSRLEQGNSRAGEGGRAEPRCRQGCRCPGGRC